MVKSRKAVRILKRSFCCAVLLACLTLLAPGFPSCAAESVPEAVSPTTGLPSGKPYRPVLVSVSNSWEARPPMHFAEADIVYEYIIWGPRYTRYLALYNDEHPPFVNSIRSIRKNALELREEWDCPLIFWTTSGHDGRKNVFDFVKELKAMPSMIIGVYRLSGANYGNIFFRIKNRNRFSPHDGSVETAIFVKSDWPIDPETNLPYEPRKPSLLFSDTPPAGGDPALHVKIPYHDDFLPEYTYNADKQVYERWYCGGKQFDGETGVRIVASNVIVQVADIWYYENQMQQPMIQAVGEGPIDAFIGGRHYKGTWRRETLKDSTRYYDESGAPLTLLPGKTFIQIVPPEVNPVYGAEPAAP